MNDTYDLVILGSGSTAFAEALKAADTAVLNGIIAPPLLVMIMLAARNPKVMREQTIGPVLTTLGWMATVGMFLALAGLAYTTLAGGG